MSLEFENFERSLRGTTIFVTGGSGFIGRPTCRLLARLGARVVNFDLNPWSDMTPEIITVQGDVENGSELDAAINLHQPTIVIHLAAFASVVSGSRQDFSSIWNGTRVLAEAFAKAKNPTRLVNISTQLVIKPGRQPSNLRDYDPYTAYGEAKAEAEAFLDKMDRPYEIVHVRPTNIWGPRHPSYPDTIMRYIEKGWYLHPAAKAPILRTYGYVDNCAGQIASIAVSRSVKNCDVLYAGDKVMDSRLFLDAMSNGLRGVDVRVTPNALLQCAANLGSLGRLIGLPIPIDRQRLMRMTTSYVVPLMETHQVMFLPITPFIDAMQRTIRWYKERDEKYRD